MCELRCSALGFFGVRGDFASKLPNLARSQADEHRGRRPNVCRRRRRPPPQKIGQTTTTKKPTTNFGFAFAPLFFLSPLRPNPLAEPKRGFRGKRKGGKRKKKHKNEMEKGFC